MAKKRPSHVSRPVYPGGTAALKKFVATHLRYPEEAKAARVEGTVVVRYGLNYAGKVTDVRIKKGIGYGCDEEAARVVKLLRFDVPQNRKKKVRIHQDLNVHFRLPKASPTPPAPASAPPHPKAEQAAATGLTIRYTTPASPKSAPATGGGYTYTVTIKK